MDLNFPPGVTDAGLENIGSKATENLVNVTGNLVNFVNNTTTFVGVCFLGVMGVIYFGHKAIVSVHQEWYGTAAVKHEVVHRGDGESKTKSSLSL